MPKRGHSYGDQITILITADQKEKLQLIAAVRQISTGAVGREAIANYLKTETHRLAEEIRQEKTKKMEVLNG